MELNRFCGTAQGLPHIISKINRHFPDYSNLLSSPQEHLNALQTFG